MLIVDRSLVQVFLSFEFGQKCSSCTVPLHVVLCFCHGGDVVEPRVLDDEEGGDMSLTGTGGLSVYGADLDLGEHQVLVMIMET